MSDYSPPPINRFYTNAGNQSQTVVLSSRNVQFPTVDTKRESLSWYLIKNSFRYTLQDPRKAVSFFIVLSLPFLYNLWRLIPKDIPLDPYFDLSTFVYQFINVSLVMLISLAWYLVLPRRAFAVKMLALAGVAFGAFICLDALPLTQHTPVWLTASSVVVVYGLLVYYLIYVRRVYMEDFSDYQQKYEGLLHDLHHDKILGSVSRLEGLMAMRNSDPLFDELCVKEVAKLRQAVSYLNQKYRDIE